MSPYILGHADAAEKRIAASAINSSLTQEIDAGCTWDRDIGHVTAMAYYLSDGMYTLESISPKIYAKGNTIVVVFSASVLTYEGKSLSHVAVSYTENMEKC